MNFWTEAEFVKLNLLLHLSLRGIFLRFSVALTLFREGKRGFLGDIGSPIVKFTRHSITSSYQRCMSALMLYGGQLFCLRDERQHSSHAMAIVSNTD